MRPGARSARCRLSARLWGLMALRAAFARSRCRGRRWGMRIEGARLWWRGLGLGVRVWVVAGWFRWVRRRGGPWLCTSGWLERRTRGDRETGWLTDGTGWDGMGYGMEKPLARGCIDLRPASMSRRWHHLFWRARDSSDRARVVSKAKAVLLPHDRRVRPSSAVCSSSLELCTCSSAGWTDMLPQDLYS